MLFCGLFFLFLQILYPKGGIIVQKMSNPEYNRYVQSLSPKSKTWLNCLKAFAVGGLICTIGQVLMNFYSGEVVGLDKELAGTATSVTLIFLSALLTGLSVYDDIAKHAGAGTLVPITGFANAVVSPAMEFKSEGWVLGVGANMFKIAGPVIVYGILASVVYGIVLWVMQML